MSGRGNWRGNRGRGRGGYRGGRGGNSSGDGGGRGRGGRAYNPDEQTIGYKL